MQALVGQVPGLGNFGQHVEAVAGPGGHVQAGDVDGHRGAGLVVLLVRIERVVHRLDAAVGPAADDDVAGPERAVLHDQLGDHAAVLVHLGLQAGAAGRAVGVGLVLVQFGHREQGHDQFVQARALGGAGLDDFRFAAPFAGQQLVFRKLTVQAIDVDAGQVDLVQGHDDRHAGRPGVADGLLGLRHDAVVGGDDQHGDVGDVGPAGPHFGEGLVAGRIDEGHGAAVLIDLVGADVLRDAAFFVRGHVQPDDPVQQRRLAVVDVAEEGDDRRAGLERLGRIGLVGRLQHLLFQRDLAADIDLDSQLGGQEFGRLGIEAGCDVAHDPQRHQLAEDLSGGNPGGFREGADGAGQLHDDFAFAGRGRVGAGATEDVGPPRGAAAGRDLFVLAAAAPLGRGRSLALGLPLLAAAQSRQPGAFAFFLGRRGLGRPPPRAIFSAGRSAGGATPRRSPRRPGGRAFLGGQIVAFLLLFVLPQVLGKRLAAGLAGANGVGGELDVGLLRGRFLGFVLADRLGRRRHGGQVHGEPWPFRRASSRPPFFSPGLLSGVRLPSSLSNGRDIDGIGGRCGIRGGSGPTASGAERGAAGPAAGGDFRMTARLGSVGGGGLQTCRRSRCRTGNSVRDRCGCSTVAAAAMDDSGRRKPAHDRGRSFHRRLNGWSGFLGRSSAATLRAPAACPCLAGSTGTFVPTASPRGQCSLRGECCGRSGGARIGRSRQRRRLFPPTAPRCPPAMNALRRTTSSSVKLASAEPFPVIPARVQISTNFLLSIWSSLARA